MPGFGGPAIPEATPKDEKFVCFYYFISVARNNLKSST